MAAPMDKDRITVSEEKTTVVLKQDRNWTHYLLGLTLAFGVTAGIANYRTIKKESRHLEEAATNPHLERIQEFDAKIRERFPKKPSVGRTEFKDLQDLADYLVSEDRKAEMRKMNKQLADETEGFTDNWCENS